MLNLSVKLLIIGKNINGKRSTNLWTTAERVEHVKEHKARECHGGITWSDDVISHLQQNRLIWTRINSVQKQKQPVLSTGRRYSQPQKSGIVFYSRFFYQIKPDVFVRPPIHQNNLVEQILELTYSIFKSQKFTFWRGSEF